MLINKVKDTMEREGHKTFTGAVFSMISGYYDDKYFSKYKEKSETKILPKEILTNEQKCEKAGGKVGVHNGGDVCIITNHDGSMTRYFPLSKPELFYKG